MNKLSSILYSNKLIIICAFLLPLLMAVWQIIDAGNGFFLLSPYTHSDTALFHYSAWFKSAFSVNSYVSDIIVLSPYERLLSASIKLFGHSNITPFVLNSVLHALSCLCVVVTTWLVFDKRTALVALILYAFCAPLLYFAGTTSKTNLVIFLIALSNLFAVLFFRYFKLWQAAVFVLIVMLCSIERIHTLVALVVFIGSLFAFRHSSPTGKYNRAIVTAFLIVFTLVGISTVKFGVEPKYVSSVGLNIYLGHSKPDNHKLRLDNVRNHLIGHRVDAREVAQEGLGRELSQSEVTLFWLNKTWLFIKENPYQYLTSQIQKTHHLFAKISNSFRTEMVNLWRSERKPLQYAIFDFGSIFALFFAGCFFVRKQWLLNPSPSSHAGVFLVFSSLFYLASMMLTIVTERYRLGSLVFMIPVAALALNKLIFDHKKHRVLTCMVLIIFIVSYALMITAPAKYNQADQVERYQKSEMKLLNSHSLATFYKTRERLDENINNDDCRILITQLKKIRFYWDVKLVKEFCLYKR